MAAIWRAERGVSAASFAPSSVAVTDAAQAQSIRDTFVNSITVKGIKQHLQSLQEIADTNDGTRGAPKRNFQPAHDALAAGGQIVVLDTAGYGALTIDRSIDAMVVDRRVTRLRIEEWYAAHAADAGRPVRGPLVVFGLPRTGTTAPTSSSKSSPGTGTAGKTTR